MAKQVAIAIQVSCSGDGISNYGYVPPASPMVNQNAPEAVPQVVQLNSGLNSIPVPSGATQCILVPPTTSSVTKAAKTTSGDAGLSFTATPILFPLTGVSTVFVSSGGAEALSIVWG